MIIFSRIFKSYGQHAVIADLSLEIRAKEFVTIVGSSGAGKSTLFSMLIGAEKPDSGAVSVDGINISKLRPNDLQMYRRKIGMIFQDYKLLPKKTVYENVAFALEACGASDEEISKKVPQVLSTVGLLRQNDEFPDDLSGGEQQRVAIARALVHDPKLIIADEPTGNLDPKNTSEIIDLLHRINKEQGVTVILTTHDMAVVDQLVERVVVLKNGRIEKDVPQAKYSDLGI